MGGSGVTASLEDPSAAGGDEFAGYSAAYAKLHYSVGDEVDVLPAVVDGKADVVQRLAQFNAEDALRNPQGERRLASLAASLDQERQSVVGEFFHNAGILS
jgi:hypothetical protein